jgi:hypothetical protein
MLCHRHHTIVELNLSLSFHMSRLPYHCTRIYLRLNPIEALRNNIRFPRPSESLEDNEVGDQLSFSFRKLLSLLRLYSNKCALISGSVPIS